MTRCSRRTWQNVMHYSASSVLPTTTWCILRPMTKRHCRRREEETPLVCLLPRHANPSSSSSGGNFMNEIAPIRESHHIAALCLCRGRGRGGSFLLICIRTCSFVRRHPVLPACSTHLNTHARALEGRFLVLQVGISTFPQPVSLGRKKIVTFWAWRVFYFELAKPNRRLKQFCARPSHSS